MDPKSPPSQDELYINAEAPNTSGKIEHSKSAYSKSTARLFNILNLLKVLFICGCLFCLCVLRGLLQS